MKNKLSKKLVILIAIILIIFILILIIKFPLACNYENHAWGYAKRTCICIGIKVDTTPQSVADAGVSTSCIGIPINNKCYTNRGNYSTHLLDKWCNKKYYNE